MIQAYNNPLYAAYPRDYNGSGIKAGLTKPAPSPFVKKSGAAEESKEKRSEGWSQDDKQLIDALCKEAGISSEQVYGTEHDSEEGQVFINDSGNEIVLRPSSGPDDPLQLAIQDAYPISEDGAIPSPGAEQIEGIKLAYNGKEKSPAGNIDSLVAQPSAQKRSEGWSQEDKEMIAMLCNEVGIASEQIYGKEPMGSIINISSGSDIFTSLNNNNKVAVFAEDVLPLPDNGYIPSPGAQQIEEFNFAKHEEKNSLTNGTKVPAVHTQLALFKVVALPLMAVEKPMGARRTKRKFVEEEEKEERVIDSKELSVMVTPRRPVCGAANKIISAINFKLAGGLLFGAANTKAQASPESTLQAEVSFSSEDGNSILLETSEENKQQQQEVDAHALPAVDEAADHVIEINHRQLSNAVEVTPAFDQGPAIEIAAADCTTTLQGAIPEGEDFEHSTQTVAQHLSNVPTTAVTPEESVAKTPKSREPAQHVIGFNIPQQAQHERVPVPAQHVIPEDSFLPAADAAVASIEVLNFCPMGSYPALLSQLGGHAWAKEVLAVVAQLKHPASLVPYVANTIDTIHRAVGYREEIEESVLRAQGVGQQGHSRPHMHSGAVPNVVDLLEDKWWGGDCGNTSSMRVDKSHIDARMEHSKGKKRSGGVFRAVSRCVVGAMKSWMG